MSRSAAPLRKRVLFEQPICADPHCTELATDVDHIVPMSQGGAEYARDNCQGLCAYHHQRKTAREGGAFPDAA
jgi:5-methylcytosine-specific restriction endonuclease McrA